MPKKKVTNEDVVQESLMIESILEQLIGMHAKTKEDLKETRTVLFIILAVNMAILGLIIGIIIRTLI